MTAPARTKLMLTLTAAAVLLCKPAGAFADEPEPQHTQLARHELWLSWSATFLLGGIAGTFALKAAALDDRVALLPRATAERPHVQEDAVSARRLAWGFGSAASLMALTSVLIWIYQPALPDQPASIAPVIGAGELGVHYHRRF